MQSGGEGIAQITEQSVADVRQVGRDDRGKPIFEVRPARYSRLLLNMAGDEVRVPLVNHRLYTDYSYKEYGREHLERLIGIGFLPKDDCPLSTKWSGVVGGDGSLMRAQEGEHACRIEPAQTQVAGWHGCEHYQRAKERRRADAKEQVAVDKKMTANDIDAIARYMAIQAGQQYQPQQMVPQSAQAHPPVPQPQGAPQEPAPAVPEPESAPPPFAEESDDGPG